MGCLLSQSRLKLSKRSRQTCVEFDRSIDGCNLSIQRILLCLNLVIIHRTFVVGGESRFIDTLCSSAGGGRHRSFFVLFQSGLQTFQSRIEFLIEENGVSQFIYELVNGRHTGIDVGIGNRAIVIKVLRSSQAKIGLSQRRFSHTSLIGRSNSNALFKACDGGCQFCILLGRSVHLWDDGINSTDDAIDVFVSNGTVLVVSLLGIEFVNLVHEGLEGFLAHYWLESFKSLSQFSVLAHGVVDGCNLSIQRILLCLNLVVVHRTFVVGGKSRVIDSLCSSASGGRHRFIRGQSGVQVVQSLLEFFIEASGPRQFLNELADGCHAVFNVHISNRAIVIKIL